MPRSKLVSYNQEFSATSKFLISSLSIEDFDRGDQLLIVFFRETATGGATPALGLLFIGQLAR